MRRCLVANPSSNRHPRAQPFASSLPLFPSHQHQHHSAVRTDREMFAKSTDVLLLLCGALFVVLVAAVESPANNASTTTGDETPLTELIILHNNDMHARFEETDALSKMCNENDALLSKCYGGFARVAYKVREFRNASTPVLYLNAGDTYTGTPWFNVYKDRIVSAFMNLLRPDAVCLGNHELDENVAGLLPYLNDAQYPVLAANLDLSAEPELAAMRSLRKSVVLRLKSVTIGIVGYLTPYTKNITAPNRIGYLDEVPAINAEAERLKAAGVQLIIALGHSGIRMDKRIAAECALVDVVIGGHDNTFLWNGRQPDAEKPYGPYPLVVRQTRTGKLVPVVQAYAFTKYLGVLRLQLHANGTVRSFAGQPLLLDAGVPHDAEVLALLEEYRPSIKAFSQHIIGESRVFLNGTCKFGECNLGNLLTDAMVHAYVSRYRGHRWSDASMALYNSGGIRTSGSSGNLSTSDLMMIMPFDEDILSVRLSGVQLLQVLEHAVHRYSYTIRRGEFLQMSGMRVVYNLTQPSGARVHEVRVLCTECEVPRYELLDAFRTYKVLVNVFMNLGGNGYEMLTHSAGEYVGVKAIQSLDEYIGQRRVIYTPVEGRIRFVGRLADDPLVSGVTGALAAATQLLLFSTTVGLLVSCGLDYWRVWCV